jgi:hypothetical protein
MKIYKLLFAKRASNDSNNFVKEDLLECSLRNNIEDDGLIMDSIKKYGVCNLWYNWAGLYTFYIDIDSAKLVSSYLYMKSIIVNYLRINKLNELNEDL